jgi:hypothetical protein
MINVVLIGPKVPLARGWTGNAVFVGVAVKAGTDQPGFVSTLLSSLAREPLCQPAV